jgi:hypothetical protein
MYWPVIPELSYSLIYPDYFPTTGPGPVMGSLITFVIIVVVLALTLIAWTMVLRFQHAKKISDSKIQYLRVVSAENNAYQHYVQAAKNLQDMELNVEKSRQTIAVVSQNLDARKKELRELIGKLRIIKNNQGPEGQGKNDLDTELELTKLTGEVKTRLIMNNEDKKRIIAERLRIAENRANIPDLEKEAEELSGVWDAQRRELERVENEFRRLDNEEFQRFSKSYVNKRSEQGNADPEREVINLILLLNNKQGMLYVRKKEAAKDPTTESVTQIKKYSDDIRKLEAQLNLKSRRLGIAAERVAELKKLFLSGKHNLPEA